MVRRRQSRESYELVTVERSHRYLRTLPSHISCLHWQRNVQRWDGRGDDGFSCFSGRRHAGPDTLRSGLRSRADDVGSHEPNSPVREEPVYIVTLAVFVILQVPTALAQNFSMLLALRFLTGFIGSPVLPLVALV